MQAISNTPFGKSETGCVIQTTEHEYQQSSFCKNNEWAEVSAVGTNLLLHALERPEHGGGAPFGSVSPITAPQVEQKLPSTERWCADFQAKPLALFTIIISILPLEEKKERTWAWNAIHVHLKENDQCSIRECNMLQNHFGIFYSTAERAHSILTPFFQYIKRRK